jgi:SPP1 gp7 family putative phage head morphogenesis protein
VSKKSSRTTKPIQPPFKAQNYYEKELTAYIDSIEKNLFKKFKFIADSEQQEGILAFMLSYIDNIPLFGEIALKFVSLVNLVNKKKFNANLEAIGFKEIINPNLEKYLELKRNDNIDLIKSIPVQLHENLKVKLKEFYENPKGKSLVKILEKEFNSSRSKAKLIARDQTAKINHGLSRQRAEANGSKSYTWRTSGDERVRSKHKKLNGKVFKWKKGSPCCGHPSDDVNCRCLALAVYN